MDLGYRNLYNKRIFGRDITNCVQKRNKNFSISEKNQLIHNESQIRLKSRSVSYKPLTDRKDPITQYQTQIVQHMCTLQKKQQKEMFKFIHEDMRYVLIDWLIQVHQTFELKEQTLYLALIYLNQFSSKAEITKLEYQLVGIACLWIASKYQQIYPPKMQNYIEVTDNSYTYPELKDMEGRIIKTLNFNLTYTTTLHILDALSDKWQKQRNINKQLVLSKQAQKVYHMCKFLLELSNISNLNKNYTVNTLVLSAITLADSIFKTKSQIKLLDQSVKPDKQTLLKCFKQMCTILQECHNSKKYNAVVKKFQKDKYSKVSKIKITQK